MNGPEITKRSRGRPRAFDEAEIVDRAMHAFWSAGFAGTSIDELVNATGLARASMYAAFSDKEQLYLRALEHAGARMARAFTEAFGSSNSMADGLAAFYRAAIAIYFSDDQARGCFVLCTAPASANDLPAVRDMLAATLTSAHDGLEAVLDRVRPGDVANALDAQLAAAALYSIAVRVRAGESRQALEAFAHQAAKRLFPGL